MPDAPAPQRRITWTLALGITLAVGFAAIGLQLDPHPPHSGLVGTPAPGFSLPLLVDGSGEPRRGPDGSRGKVLLLHFWAPSCAPCLTELPQWQALYAKSRLPDSGFDVLTVAGDEADDVRAFLRQNAYTFPTVHDSTGGAHRLYKVFGIPHTVAIAPDGRIAVELSGPQEADELQAALDAARRP